MVVNGRGFRTLLLYESSVDRSYECGKTRRRRLKIEKIVLLLGLVLLALTACGQKKSHTASSASTSEDKLDNLADYFQMRKEHSSNKDSLSKKREWLTAKKQVVTYKDEQFLSLSIRAELVQNAKMIWQAIKEYGVEEAQQYQ